MRPIAKIHTNLSGKFGIPRQSGVVAALKGIIQFEEPYRNPDALRGLSEFSHIWLLWRFSESIQDPDDFRPLVRPPKLGGNKQMGVFATRSPFRPNSIGMTVCKIDKIDLESEGGPFIHVSGIDLMDGTPILDIKPYVPYSDIVPDALQGFTKKIDETPLKVLDPKNKLSIFNEENRNELKAILTNDPRPGYQEDTDRIYGIIYLNKNVRFKIKNHTLTIYDIENI